MAGLVASTGQAVIVIKSSLTVVIVTYLYDEGFPSFMLILEICCSFEHQNLENINRRTS